MPKKSAGDLENLVQFRDLFPGLDYELMVDAINLADPQFGYLYDQIHQHDFYQIYYLENGSASVSYDFREYSFEGPALVFVPARKLHCLHISEDARGYFLCFSSAFCSSEILQGLKLSLFYRKSGPVLDIPAEYLPSIHFYVKKINNEIKLQSVHSDDCTRALFQLLLIELSRLTMRDEVADPDRGQLISQKYLELLETEFKKQPSLDFFAKSLGITTNLLHDKLKQSLGKTPGAILRDRLVTEAKNLLRYSTMSISEISYELNFTEPSYFSRFFKKNTGKTPAEFRSDSAKVAART